MRPKDLRALGIPPGEAMASAVEAVKRAAALKMCKRDIRSALQGTARNPEAYLKDAVFGSLARVLAAHKRSRTLYVPRAEPAPHRQWGTHLEHGALVQMENACALPVAVRGALMPDAHQGYGLPIGGVLAVEDAVIPYAVGMDIGCRMKLSVIDLPVVALEKKRSRLAEALERETRFGVGAKFVNRRAHDVMDEDWRVSPVTASMKDTAWAQLGTSGSGNHFVEFGTLTLEHPELGLDAGVYVALLSHSGARGAGAEVARHYSKLAMSLHPELPKTLLHLSWLDLNDENGQAYWQAMELMGKYAAANHSLIHSHVLDFLGTEVIASVENHHNFAWKERHFDRDVIVHRKGATPSHADRLGIIPGSMGTPGFVVRGKGETDSLCSASHGAGRKMSRTEAKQRFSRNDLDRFLKERGVVLLSGGIDEVPMAYKDIDTVMDAQSDLVLKIARFDPKLVKMAPEGEAPED